jgi:hypothetical protein
MDKEFIPGLKLSEFFHNEIITQILKINFTGVKYTAGLIGYGSEVIGFDDPQSTDHMWGPRLYIFLDEKDYPTLHKKMLRTITKNLPYKFKGYTVNFSKPDPDDGGVQTPEDITSGEVNPLIWITTIKKFFKEYLNIDPHSQIKFDSWLTFPEHRLLAVTAGKIFHDDLCIESVRNKFRYYPEDVWLFMLASQWKKISQEEAFPGRCNSVEDRLGRQIVLTRIIHHLMYLCFLMEKQYSTYNKWFGSAFKKLSIAEKLQPIFENCITSPTWQDQENLLCKAYSIIAQKHNSLKITEELDINTRNYFDRPYKVLFTPRFIDAIDEIMRDKYPKLPNNYIGSVNQFSDIPDVYDNSKITKKLKSLYLKE